MGDFQPAGSDNRFAGDAVVGNTWIRAVICAIAGKECGAVGRGTIALNPERSGTAQFRLIANLLLTVMKYRYFRQDGGVFGVESTVPVKLAKPFRAYGSARR